MLLYLYTLTPYLLSPLDIKNIKIFDTLGKVLLDRAGIVIIYVNNTLPVKYLFNKPIDCNDNSSGDIDRYAVRWGPLVGPKTMDVENTTIIPAVCIIF